MTRFYLSILLTYRLLVKSPMQEYSIRRAKPRDIKTLAHLNNRIFPEDHAIDFSVGVWWVVEDWAMRPAGFCGLTEYRRAGYVFLKRAGILYSHRGNRLHRRLISVRLRYAKQHGFGQSITYTLLDNTWSSNNLIRAGFKLYLPPERWVGDQVLYWVRWL